MSDFKLKATSVTPAKPLEGIAAERINVGDGVICRVGFSYRRWVKGDKPEEGYSLETVEAGEKFRFAKRCDQPSITAGSVHVVAPGEPWLPDMGDK